MLTIDRNTAPKIRKNTVLKKIIVKTYFGFINSEGISFDPFICHRIKVFFPENTQALKNTHFYPIKNVPFVIYFVK